MADSLLEQQQQRQAQLQAMAKGGSQGPATQGPPQPAQQQPQAA
jgi:hypothetical protein